MPAEVQDKEVGLLQNRQESTRAFGRDVFSMHPMPTGSEQAGRERPMDPQLPSWQSSTDSTPIGERVLLESVSFPDGILAGSCSTPASIQHKRPLQRKGSGIHELFQPSTLSLRGVFSLQSSFVSSNIMNHRVESDVDSFPPRPSAFSGSSSRRLPKSKWHQCQSDRRYATFCFHRRSEVRGILHRSKPLGAK